MAILQMKRINIYAMLRYQRDILETLQRLGVVQIEGCCVEDSVFYKTDSSSFASSYIRSASTMAQGSEIIGEYSEEKKPMFASLKGRTVIGVKEYDLLAQRNHEAFDIVYKLLGYKKKITEAKADIITCRSKIEALTPLEKLDVPLDVRDTVSSSTVIGSFPEKLYAEILTERINETAPDLERFYIETVCCDENQTCIFAVCYKDDYEAFMNALRKIGLLLPSITTPDNPAKEIKYLKERIQKNEENISDNINAIKALAEKRELLRFFEDYYVMKADRYARLSDLSYSSHTFVMTGYIPAKDGEKIKKLLAEKFMAEVELENADGDDVPVLLRNNAFASPAEGVLLSYSAPSHRELDPTSVMAFFYYIFFGMMFSDAGYGIVMSLVCGLCLLKFKNMESGLRKSIKLFFYCGLSTIFWGLMFGSFFGDAVFVIYNTFIGKAPPLIPGITTPIWFNPTVGSGPTKLLMFSFLFGIIHLFAGLILQAINYITDGNILYAVYDDLSWILLVTGAVLALLSTDMLSGMMGGFRLSSVFLVIGGIIAAVGAVIILVYSGRVNKNPFKRLLKGAYNLYGATSYISDILSYSRLLALGLASGVVAGVFNQLGSMMGNGVPGIIVFAVVFVVGHLLNIGINALGAYVHTNRLQFVEFFGKFYKGGGREFKPYAANTKYYNIKENV